MSCYIFPLKYNVNINNDIIFAKKYKNNKELETSKIRLYCKNAKLGLGRYGPNISINSNFDGNDSFDITRYYGGSIYVDLDNIKLENWSLTLSCSVYDMNYKFKNPYIINIPSIDLSLNISGNNNNPKLIMYHNDNRILIKNFYPGCLSNNTYVLTCINKSISLYINGIKYNLQNIFCDKYLEKKVYIGYYNDLRTNIDIENIGLFDYRLSINQISTIYNKGLESYVKDNISKVNTFYSKAIHFDKQWYLNKDYHDVISVWNYYGEGKGYTGKNININVNDSGICDWGHPDIYRCSNMNFSKIIKSVHMANTNIHSSVESFTNIPSNHSTSCIGLISARGRTVGISPESNICSTKWYKEGIESNIDSIDICSCSWGPSEWSDHESDYWDRSIEAKAIKNGIINGRKGKGIIYCFANGNERSSKDNSNFDSLVRHRYTIACASVEKHDSNIKLSSQAWYSDYGSCILVSAYGSEGTDSDGIFTIDVSNCHNTKKSLGYTNNCFYKNFSGSSAAAPIISGIIACILEANNNLNWREIQHILVNSCDKIGISNVYDDKYEHELQKYMINSAGHKVSNAYGHGVSNCMKAVTLAIEWKNKNKAIGNYQTLLEKNFNIFNSKMYISKSDIDFRNDINYFRQISYEFNHCDNPIATINIKDNIIIEHVEIKLKLSHTDAHTVLIILESPSGVKSFITRGVKEIINIYKDYYGNNNYLESDLKIYNKEEYSFSSTLYWDEESIGLWKLHVIDLNKYDNNTGMVHSASLKLYGRPKIYSNKKEYIQQENIIINYAGITENDIYLGIYNLDDKLLWKSSKIHGHGNINVNNNYTGLLKLKIINNTGSKILNQTSITVFNNILTESPTNSPTKSPTNSPTKSPTNSPTESPTNSPTESPTNSPTESPTNSPTESPTKSKLINSDVNLYNERKPDLSIIKSHSNWNFEKHVLTVRIENIGNLNTSGYLDSDWHAIYKLSKTEVNVQSDLNDFKVPIKISLQDLNFGDVYYLSWIQGFRSVEKVNENSSRDMIIEYPKMDDDNKDGWGWIQTKSKYSSMKPNEFITLNIKFKNDNNESLITESGYYAFVADMPWISNIGDSNELVDINNINSNNFFIFYVDISKNFINTPDLNSNTLSSSYLDNKNYITRKINLNQGWNWISIPLKTSSAGYNLENIKIVSADLENLEIYIKNSNNDIFYVNKKWSTVNFNFKITNCYIIYTNKEILWEVTGYEEAITDFKVVKNKWNYISGLIAKDLWKNSSEGSIIKSIDKYCFKKISPHNDLGLISYGSLKNISDLEGYMFYDSLLS